MSGGNHHVLRHSGITYVQRNVPIMNMEGIVLYHSEIT